MKTWPLTALVLTAGLGTRLRPLTDVRAKPALPVGEEALVCRVLRQLAAQGVRHAVLNLYHLPATIAAEVGDGRQLGLSVRYAWEHPGPLGSAGSIRHMLPLVSDERLLVVNGDTLCDLPVQALAETHAASGALVTMGLMPHPAPEKYNGVVLDEGGAVTGFSTPGAWTTTWHYPGVQVTERRVFETLPDNEPAEYVKVLYPELIAAQPGAVRGFVHHGRFRDIGTVDDYRATCVELAGDGNGNVIAPAADVHPTAVLTRTIVWAGGRVEAGCRLEDCIVTDRAVVPAGTQAVRDVFL